MITLGQKDGRVEIRDISYTHTSKTNNPAYGCCDLMFKANEKSS